MNKEQAKKAASVMLAWADGKTIECKRKDGESWSTFDAGTMSLAWDWSTFDYRVKPEPTCLKLEAKLAERNRYIEELENRLRSLWDKYYADSNHHMERIKRLEEAGNDLDSWLDRETPVTIRTNWRQAKETKP